MVIESISNRRSGFAFADKAIEPEKLQEIFKAASLAPSSMNIQPWRFVYANHGDPEFTQILDTLAEGNRRWAKDAAILVLSIAQVEYTFDNKIFQNAYAWHDTGMANALLMLQAASLGIISHPMGGFDHEKVAEAFGLGKEYQPVAVIALGYKGDESNLPDDLKRRQSSPRVRKSLEVIVFKSRFA